MPIGLLMNKKAVSKRLKVMYNKQKRKENPNDWKKTHSKSQWKLAGIILNDFNKTYDDYYIKTHFCEYCDNPFKNNQDRQMDHDHSILNRQNIRGVLCAGCNMADVFHDYFDFMGDCY